MMAGTLGVRRKRLVRSDSMGPSLQTIVERPGWFLLRWEATGVLKK